MDGAQSDAGTADFFGLGESGDAFAQMFGDMQRLFSFGAGSLFERHMAEQMQRLFEPGRVGGWDRCSLTPTHVVFSGLFSRLTWLSSE